MCRSSHEHNEIGKRKISTLKWAQNSCAVDTVLQALHAAFVFSPGAFDSELGHLRLLLQAMSSASGSPVKLDKKKLSTLQKEAYQLLNASFLKQSKPTEAQPQIGSQLPIQLVIDLLLQKSHPRDSGGKEVTPISGGYEFCEGLASAFSFTFAGTCSSKSCTGLQADADASVQLSYVRYPFLYEPRRQIVEGPEIIQEVFARSLYTPNPVLVCPKCGRTSFVTRGLLPNTNQHCFFLKFLTEPGSDPQTDGEHKCIESSYAMRVVPKSFTSELVMAGAVYRPIAILYRSDHHFTADLRYPADLTDPSSDKTSWFSYDDLKGRIQPIKDVRAVEHSYQGLVTHILYVRVPECELPVVTLGMLLVVDPVYAEKFFDVDQPKQLEIRKTTCLLRHRIGIATAGTHSVIGAVSITDSREYSPSELASASAMEQHQIPESEIVKYGTFGWSIAKPRKFEKPIPHKPKQGVVTWERITTETRGFAELVKEIDYFPAPVVDNIGSHEAIVIDDD